MHGNGVTDGVIKNMEQSMSEVDWERLQNPPEPFKLIRPDYNDIEFHKRIVRLKHHLLNKYLETSDEHRNEQYLDYVIKGGFFGYGTAMYEAGDFDALVGFINPIQGFKCNMSLNLIDKKIWGKEFIRASRKLIDMYMDEFKLKRISTQTADPKIVKVAKMVGFKIEGERPLDFMWNEHFFTTYLLGLTREEE